MKDKITLAKTQTTLLKEKIELADDALKKISEADQKLTTLIENTEIQSKNFVSRLRKLVESTETETSTAKTKVSGDGQKISELLAKSENQQAAILTISEEAGGLEEQISEYREKFTEFDKQLGTRDASYDQAKGQLDQLIISFKVQEKSIDDLTDKSEKMLTGATVAGLAAKFEDIRKELTTELESARKSFNWGIFFLFVSSLPLLAFVFLPIFDPTKFNINSSVSGWQYVGQVLARFVILVPAAWFVSFSAIRHSSLFQLKEHYTYKYSMAVSVDGFKKQAKGYESEIAALVLEQLAFNPADKLAKSKDLDETSTPTPMMRYFVEKFGKKVDDATKTE